MTNMNSIIN